MGIKAWNLYGASSTFLDGHCSFLSVWLLSRINGVRRKQEHYYTALVYKDLLSLQLTTAKAVAAERAVHGLYAYLKFL